MLLLLGGTILACALRVRTIQLQCWYVASHAEHLLRGNLPADSQGKLCGYDVQHHPYLYFLNVNDIVRQKQRRIAECVSKNVR